MPMMKFDDSPVSWSKIMNNIIHSFAPAVPIGYIDGKALQQETPPEDDLDLDIRPFRSANNSMIDKKRNKEPYLRKRTIKRRSNKEVFLK